MTEGSTADVSQTSEHYDFMKPQQQQPLFRFPRPLILLNNDLSHALICTDTWLRVFYVSTRLINTHLTQTLYHVHTVLGSTLNKQIDGPSTEYFILKSTTSVFVHYKKYLFCMLTASKLRLTTTIACSKREFKREGPKLKFHSFIHFLLTPTSVDALVTFWST